MSNEKLPINFSREEGRGGGNIMRDVLGKPGSLTLSSSLPELTPVDVLPLGWRRKQFSKCISLYVPYQKTVKGLVQLPECMQRAVQTLTSMQLMNTCKIPSDDLVTSNCRVFCNTFMAATYCITTTSFGHVIKAGKTVRTSFYRPCDTLNHVL